MGGRREERRDRAERASVLSGKRGRRAGFSMCNLAKGQWPTGLVCASQSQGTCSPQCHDTCLTGSQSSARRGRTHSSSLYRKWRVDQVRGGRRNGSETVKICWAWLRVRITLDDLRQRNTWAGHPSPGPGNCMKATSWPRAKMHLCLAIECAPWTTFDCASGFGSSPSTFRAGYHPNCSLHLAPPLSFVTAVVPIKFHVESRYGTWNYNVRVAADTRSVVVRHTARAGRGAMFLGRRPGGRK